MHWSVDNYQEKQTDLNSLIRYLQLQTYLWSTATQSYVFLSALCTFTIFLDFVFQFS